MKRISVLLFSALLLMFSMNVAAETRLANDAASLNAAIVAAQTGDIVQLTADVNLEATTLQIVKPGVEFTLDLNGHNLTGTNCSSSSYGIIRMQHGTLTIKTSQAGGSIGAAASKYSLNVSSSANENHDGTIILESGTIYAQNYAVSLNGGAGSFIMNGGEVIAEATTTPVYAISHSAATCSTTINGGKISAKTTSTSTSAKAYGVYASNMGVVVNDGTIVAEAPVATSTAAFTVYGSTTDFVSIRGGYFNAIGGKTAQPTDLYYAKNLTGGKFAKLPNTTYLDDGYKMVDCDETINGVHYIYEIVPTGEKYFAIGGTEYAGLQDAIDAANDGDVIKLIKSTSNAVQKEYFFPAGKSLTLDLNGLTLDRTGLTSAAESHTAFNLFGNLTIKDQVGNGVIKCPSPAGILAKGGALTLESGKIEADVTVSSGYARPIMLNSGSAFTMNGGELFAKISGSATTCYALHIAAGATATINGGKIYAESQIDNKTIDAIMCAGIVTVNDVEMCIRNTGTSTNALAFVGNSNGTQVINGGKFVVDGNTTSSDGLFTDNTKIFGGRFNRDVQTWVPLGEPYMCLANAGLGTCFDQALTHEVVENPAATAYIRNVTQSKNYTSISAAFAEAADNDELCLLEDMDFAQASLTIDKPITFDINGHNLTANSAVLYLIGGVDEDHTLVLTDKAATKGLISGAAPIRLKGGYVKVDGIKVTGVSNCFNEQVKGNYTIQNVEATTNATASATAVVYYPTANSITTISNCTFTLDASGLSIATSSSSYVAVFNAKASSNATSGLSIRGGTYKVINTNTGNAQHAGIFFSYNDYIKIYDGFFSVEGAAKYKYLWNTTSTTYLPRLQIYGGKFNIDPAKNLADGFVASNISEGIYTYAVTEKNVASVNGTEYKTISEAINAAKLASAPVELLHSTVLTSTLDLPAGVTFAATSYTVELAANTPIRLEDGATIPACVTNTNFVASIPVNNATYYFYSLDKAVSACGSTQTVKLLQDVENGAKITISSGTKTIDFNGHNYSSSKDMVFYVSANIAGSTTVNLINSSATESIVECTNAELQSEGLHVDGASGTVNVTVNARVTIKGSYGATVWKNATLNIYGKVVGKRSFAVGGNGQAQYAGTTINIYDGAEIEGPVGIYHPQAGDLNINGGTITGKIALGLKAGTVNISGGTLHATGECNRQNGWSNGIEASGAAIQLESNKSYAAHVNLNITAGEFISDNCYAFYEYVAKNSEHSSSDAITISGGKFDGNVQISQDMAYTIAGFIDGGNFSHDIVAFCKEGYTTKKHLEGSEWDGTYDVVPIEAEDDKNATTTGVMPATTETSQLTIADDVAIETNEGTTEVQKLILGAGSKLIVKDGTTLNVGAGGIHLADEEEKVSSITVEAGGMLAVDGLIYNSTVEKVTIEADAEGRSGVLLISPVTEVIGEDHPKATVELISRACKKNGKYVWQRFGVPANVSLAVKDIKKVGHSYPSGYDYWDYSNKKWVAVEDGNFAMLPFVCYQQANDAPAGGNKYAFECNLIGNGDATLHFEPGFNFYANSYTAPIDIHEMLSDYLDKHPNISATAYVYHANENNWEEINLGTLEDATQTDIKPMQAFVFENNGSNQTTKVDYTNYIWNPIMDSQSPSAPRRVAHNNTRANIILTGADGMTDRVVVCEDARFSASFDNGYDAAKFSEGDRATFALESNDGKMGVIYTDDLAGQALTLTTKDETSYTITFANVRGEQLALRDNLTGTTTAIAADQVYCFSAPANAEIEGRFEIVKGAKAPTAIEENEAENQIRGIYTVTGQYMGTNWNTVPAGVYVVNGQKMVK